MDHGATNNIYLARVSGLLWRFTITSTGIWKALAIGS
jgi:hypothetical protein